MFSGAVMCAARRKSVPTRLTSSSPGCDERKTLGIGSTPTPNSHSHLHDTDTPCHCHHRSPEYEEKEEETFVFPHQFLTETEAESQANSRNLSYNNHLSTGDAYDPRFDLNPEESNKQSQSHFDSCSRQTADLAEAMMEAELSQVYNKHRYLILSIPDKAGAQQVKDVVMQQEAMTSHQQWKFGASEGVANLPTPPATAMSLPTQVPFQQQLQQGVSQPPPSSSPADANDVVAASIRELVSSTGVTVDDKRRALSRVIGELLMLHESLSPAHVPQVSFTLQLINYFHL